jgi:hypothetical protein
MWDDFAVLLATATCAHGATGLIRAYAAHLRMRARVELVRSAVRLPQHVEITERGTNGEGWTVRTGPAEGSGDDSAG